MPAHQDLHNPIFTYVNRLFHQKCLCFAHALTGSWFRVVALPYVCECAGMSKFAKYKHTAVGHVSEPFWGMRLELSIDPSLALGLSCFRESLLFKSFARLSISATNKRKIQAQFRDALWDSSPSRIFSVSRWFLLIQFFFYFFFSILECEWRIIQLFRLFTRQLFGKTVCDTRETRSLMSAGWRWMWRGIIPAMRCLCFFTNVWFSNPKVIFFFQNLSSELYFGPGLTSPHLHPVTNNHL